MNACTSTQLTVLILFSFSLAFPNDANAQSDHAFGSNTESSSRKGLPSSRRLAVSTNNPIQLTVQPSHSVADSDSVAKPSFFYANPGPWGKLKCFYIFLEPSQNVVDRLQLPGTEICWTFKRSSELDLGTIFRKAELPLQMQQSLLNSMDLLKSADEISVYPKQGDVEAMTPKMREAIYPFLVDSSPGMCYSAPFLISTDTFEEWFRHSSLRPEIIAKFSQLAYRRGSLLAFSDVAIVMNEAKTELEKGAILKALYRTRSLMVQIELTQEENLKEILNYWGSSNAHHRKDIEPILQSVIDTKGVDVLGLVHLLPPLPRKLLYTYAGSDYSAKGMFPDCHWTSMNFFNFYSHDYLLDSKRLTHYVKEHFTPVEDAIKFGDVLFFVERQTGEFLHSSVYIADDLVFTKNGQNGTSPWVIMKLAELSAYYSSFTKLADISTHAFRQKKLLQP